MKYSCDVKIERDNSFELEKWNDVPTKYWPVYAWSWGSEVDKEGIDLRLKTLYENGIRGVYILPLPKNFRPEKMPTNLEPDYLTEEYFEMYLYTVQRAEKLGMQLYLYDEGGWPSGSACGKVVENRPYLKRRNVEKVEKESPYVPSENAIAAYSDGKKIMPGEESDKPIIEYVAKQVVSRMAPAAPDLAEEETAECFLELTHEEYKKQLGAAVFGKTITMAFTDEPGVSNLPWSEKFHDDFKKRYGYDFCDYLPALADKNYNTEEEKQFATEYYDFLSERFAKNYYLKLRDWCRENNIYSTGHINGEDATINCIKTNYYHALRQLRCFDVPGIDVIWRQIFPGQKNHFFPRLASSAASQVGSSMAITETFGVYGAGLTFDQMRYVAMHQMVRGINVINSAGLTYKLEGFFRTGIRPYFFPSVPNWKHLSKFNEYTARMSYLMNLGKSETDYAIYMPMRDMWAHGEEAEKAAEAFDSLGFYMEEHNCQFDIIDDDFLETADLRDGRLTTGDAAYKSIIIPDCKRIPDHSKKVLSDFEKAGGEVIYSNSPENLVPTVNIVSKKTAVLKKTIDDGKIYLIVNEDAEADLITVQFNEKGNLYYFDCENGKIFRIDSINNMSFASGEGKVFLVTDKEHVAEIYREAKNEHMTIDDFEAKCISAFEIGEITPVKKEYNEEYTKAELGDWCERYGKDFSGLVSYRTSFTLDEVKSVKLSLGEVKYSCEVIVNGESIGICMAKPFEIWIDEKYLEKENELEIIVANTSANQYVYTNVFDSFTEKEIGPYHNITLEFEKESIESGLIGPVKIFV